MASERAIQILYEEIARYRVKAVSGTYFIHKSKLRDILSASRIKDAVDELECGVSDRIGLATKIYSEGIITFAILIWMQRADAITVFRNHEFLDSRLPIHETHAREIAPEFGTSFATEYQWQFLPYVFRKDMCDHHREIRETNVIFPFLDSVEMIGEGSFGEVSKVQIPTSLQEFLPGTVS